ncbi:hypothetical protein HNY73_000516 [Argiope bruennichi]|uniref:Uncharacterized protein n=1 Tax=Argiope bruennichi TaxID=94029 RepID=A0A8T0G0Q1_ARGBR|nr:hypothetical protein HNY73_000516 [Argiope bruennichi]
MDRRGGRGSAKSVLRIKDIDYAWDAGASVDRVVAHGIKGRVGSGSYSFSGGEDKLPGAVSAGAVRLTMSNSGWVDVGEGDRLGMIRWLFAARGKGELVGGGRVSGGGAGGRCVRVRVMGFRGCRLRRREWGVDARVGFEGSAGDRNTEGVCGFGKNGGSRWKGVEKDGRSSGQE